MAHLDLSCKVQIFMLFLIFYQFTNVYYHLFVDLQL